MSAGTPSTTVRLPRALHAEIDAYLRRRELLPTVEPWSMTDFLTCAARELLRKKAWRAGKALPIQQLPQSELEETLDAVFIGEELIELGDGSTAG